MNKKNIIIFVSFIISFNIQTAFAKNKYVKDFDYKYVGVVTADRVNIRSGSNLTYEIIGAASKEDKLYVIDKKKDWVSVSLPRSMSLWVHSKLIKKQGNKGVILKDGVNVRVRPSTQHSIICQIYKDDEIDIIDKKKDWLKIKAPVGSIGWIHKKYLKYFLSIEEYGKLLKKEKVKKLYNAVEKIYQAELLTKENANKDYILSLYKNIFESYPEYPESELAKSRYNFIKEIAAIEEMAKIEDSWNEKINDKIYDMNNFKTIYKDFIDKYPGLEITSLAKERLKFFDKKDTIIVCEKSLSGKELRVKKKITGVVHELGVLINRPGTHKLVKNGNIICLLKSDKEDLNDYIYQKVHIEGMLVTVRGWDIPVFEIKKIKKIKWKGRM